MLVLKRLLSRFINLVLSNKLLFAIFVCGLFLRLWGVRSGYPPYHPDEPQIYSRAMLTILGRVDELGYYGYPALVPLIHSLLYFLIFLPISIIKELIVSPDLIFKFTEEGFTLTRFLQNYIFGVREINILLWGRYISAFLGSLSILATYLVGKNYFNKKVGIIASFILAVNYMHILSSHFALVDVPNDLFVLLVFFPTLNLLKRGKVIDYIICGLVCSLSFSVKFSPFMLVCPLIAHLIRIIEKKEKLFSLKICIVPVAFVGLSLIINFYHFVHFDTTLKDFAILSKRYVLGNYKLILYPYLYLYKFGITPILSIFAILGIIRAFFVDYKKSLILIFPIILFLFSLTYYSRGGYYVRNFTGVLPEIFIFSALTIDKICFYLGKVIKKQVLLDAVLLVSLIIVTYPSWRDVIILDLNYSKMWNYLQAKGYFEKNYKNETISTYPTTRMLLLPNVPDDKVVDAGQYMTLPELREAKVDQIIFDTDSLSDNFTWYFNKSPKGYGVMNKPRDLLYSTFMGGVVLEMLPLRTVEFMKPHQAPETNFFVIDVLPEPTFKSKEIIKDDFEKTVTWKIKGGKMDKEDLWQLFGNTYIQNGCIFIGPTANTLRISSEPYVVEDEHYYKITAKVKSDADIDIIGRNGFIRAELFNNKEDASSNLVGVRTALSSRHYGPAGKWTEESTYIYAPKGLRYLTVSFQVNKGGKENFFFDDLRIEESIEPVVINEANRKTIPEDLIFINRIL